MTDIVDELQWRGLLAQTTDLEELRQALSAGPVTYYCGFDPTAPSLHVGNLVQLLTMRRIQDAGHKPLALVGGATGLIGDPSGRSAERQLNSQDVVAGWVERIKGQVSRFLSFEGENGARMVNNLDWTGGMTVIDFLRDVGKHFPVNKMLAREVVASRLESGLSYTEFSYQLLQSMDFLELHRRYGCVLQSGGSDQWGNLTAGADLIRRSTGHHVHAISTPLLTKPDGTKYGKTAGGAIWLDPELTSPYAFFQYWVNVEDGEVGKLLRTFSFRSRAEIEELEKQSADRPAARIGQRALAEELTTLVHGAEETAKVIAASAALFGQGGLEELDEATLTAALAETPKAEVPAGELPSVADLLVASGLCASKSEARRAIKQGGAYLNNVKVAGEEAVPETADLLHGRFLVLRRGKRTLGSVIVG
ncbi:tyrosyl-tRNA synthetase [Actinocorallia herbida]|uniref:Tyrosine--tRNA ligase n=1 Tax=Actinocorallia herbida TaxID=58109 RepID=A0A3N1CRZ8_9ACTN|nr:tyrosine--tRNA ligase [Actinocorallia herbida]ROO84090.1 tyrosyl-tRNA synthetase [Actinocorallia herbida]